MAGQIKRNPWQMQKKAKELENAVERLREVLQKNLLIMEKNESDFDSNVKKTIKRYNELAAELEKELYGYERLYEAMKKNAQQLIDMYENPII